MSEEKKPGFFKRLFGRSAKPEPQPEPALSEQPAAEPVVVAKKPPAKAAPKTKPAAKAKPAARPKSTAKADAKLKAEAEAKVKAKAKARAATEAKAKAEADAKAKAEAKAAEEAKAKAEAQAKAEADAKAEAEVKAAADAKAKAEAQAKAEAEAKAAAAVKAKAEAQAKAEADAKAKAESQARIDAEAKAKAEAEAEAKAKAIAPPAPIAEKPEKKGWFSRLKDGLTRSSTALTENITAVFTKRKLDADTIQELEDILIQADLGIDTAMRITDAIAKDRFDKEVSSEEVRNILATEVEAVLAPVAQPLDVDGGNAPFVILVVGVNGTGKTTTIGKLAANFKTDGKSVMLAAGDTFRAAAIDQLKIWGERADVPVISRDVGADAAGLAFDALNSARETGSDILIIDTAGRLQNKTDLMAELEKVIRVIKKQEPGAPHAVLLVLDATTGQNALNQVDIFQKVAGVTGLIVTKLDGTARGGILVAIAAKYGLPVHAIGVGEGIEDMQPFDAGEFASAIAGMAQDQDQAA